jgi:uncharacterized membrane protein
MANDITTMKMWGKVRLEALSDGVFAIALTLLVLDVRVAELKRGMPAAEALRALRAIGPSLASFFITFILGGSFWFMHHATVHSVKYITRGVAMINLFFLMFVGLLPFSTGLLGSLGPGHPVALAIYFINQLALGLVLNVLWFTAKRQKLLEPHATESVWRLMIAAQPFACAVALAAIAVSPIISYYGFVAVMLISRGIGRRRYKHLPAGAPAPL